jgi:hypothetical protein
MCWEDSEMYPRQFFEIYPAFPDSLDVFVIMSFDEKFTPRWMNVIDAI